MSDKELSWRFLEERVVESPAVERARRASLEHGIDPITASAGQYIATIATAIDARSIIEVGTGLAWERYGLPKRVPMRTSPQLTQSLTTTSPCGN